MFEHVHIPLTRIQRAILVCGTGISSFLNPARADSIAVFGEVTGERALEQIHAQMLADPEGAEILRDKPRINSSTVDLAALAQLDEGTFGREYLNFLEVNKVTPDSRLSVKFIKDPELAYVMQRYREIHDLVHTVTGQPTNMLGEVLVKWIEGIQTGLPMCVLGGVAGATRLRPKQRGKYTSGHLRWAIDLGHNSRPLMNIYYEKRWAQQLIEIRRYISPLLSKIPK